jgi:hypothetical protein
LYKKEVQKPQNGLFLRGLFRVLMGKNQHLVKKGGSKTPKLPFPERPFEGFNGQKSAFWSKRRFKNPKMAFF